MQTKELSDFTGLDLRNIDEVTPRNAFREAVNVDLTVGNGFKTRDQLRLWHKVAPESVGLYSAGGALRCAVPIRKGTAAPRPPLGMEYDFIGSNSTGYPTTYDPEAVTSSGAWFSVPYIVVSHVDPVTNARTYSHFYLGKKAGQFAAFASATATDVLTLAAPMPADVQAKAVGGTVWFTGGIGTPPSSYVILAVVDSTHIQIDTVVTLPTGVTVNVLVPINNQVPLPFVAGPAMLVHANRVWAGAISDRCVWHSTTADPTNYLDPADAGFLNSANHIDGDQAINGLYVYRNQLGIFYQRSAQVWNVAAIDPTTFGMAESAGGAGTESAKSVANVLGDLIYFAEGGFRLLSAVITTGQPKAGDIGAKIQSLTAPLDPDKLPPFVAVWSSSRSQYLCAAGRQVFCYTFSPTSDTKGWTTYNLPFEVSAMVEHRGELYVRRADAPEVYVFDPATTYEEKTFGFNWTVRLPFTDFDTARYLKHFKFFVPHMRGSCKLDAYLDPDDMTDMADDCLAEAGHVDPTGAKLPLLFHAEMVSFRFSGTDWCLVDEMLVRFDVGNLL